MKLIDLLVQELPKFGGWPVDASFITQDSDGAVNSYSSSPEDIKTNEYGTWLHREDWNRYEFEHNDVHKCEDRLKAIVTREQYNAAFTEADSKREEAIKAMMDCSAVLLEVTADLIYDAIAAGKIPGVKLE